MCAGYASIIYIYVYIYIYIYGHKKVVNPPAHILKGYGAGRLGSRKQYKNLPPKGELYLSLPSPGPLPLELSRVGSIRKPMDVPMVDPRALHEPHQLPRCSKMIHVDAIMIVHDPILIQNETT